MRYDHDRSDLNFYAHLVYLEADSSWQKRAKADYQNE